MSEWKVQLSFVEGNSNKFWRARIDGTTLYVNYGRIGSDGQTQVKSFGSAEAAEKEFQKLEREKRKKGYEDWDASAAAEEEPEEDEDADEEDEEEEAPKKKAPAKAEAKPAKEEPKPEPASVPAATPRPVGGAAIAARAAAGSRVEHADFALDAEGRHIDLRVSFDGTSVRTIVVERYPNPADAEAAFKRLKEQMTADGYQKVPARDTL